MTVSRVWAFGLVLCGFGAGTTGALALDAPHNTLHHAKAAERHIIEPHRTAGHHASTRGTAAKSATGHTRTPATPTANQPRRTARGTARVSARRAALTTSRHRWHERFTASSFASGDTGAGDVTAGEDPVVRQAAIDALGDMNGTAVVIDPSNGRILA